MTNVEVLTEQIENILATVWEAQDSLTHSEDEINEIHSAFKMYFERHPETNTKNEKDPIFRYITDLLVELNEVLENLEAVGDVISDMEWDLINMRPEALDDLFS